MPQKQKDDPDGRSKIEPDHPFQQVQAAFDFREPLVDGGKPVLVRSKSFGRPARFVFGRAGRKQGIVKLGDHRGHRTNLARSRRRRKSFRDLLASVYGCFSEGFDTADLKTAKALLAELS